LDAPGWECDGCQYEFVKSEPGPTDFSEFYILLWAIFKPDLYQQYNEWRQLNEGLASHINNPEIISDPGNLVFALSPETSAQEHPTIFTAER
jgi:hypothetical protein